MTWASSTSWCGRTTSSPPCEATDDDGGNSSLAGSVEEGFRERAWCLSGARGGRTTVCNARVFMSPRACLAQRAATAAEKFSAPRLSSRVARRGPVDRSVSSRRGQPDRARSPRPAVVSFARTDRNPVGRFGSRDIARILWFRACRVVARNTDTDKPSIHGSFFRREGIHNLVDQ